MGFESGVLGNQAGAWRQTKKRTDPGGGVRFNKIVFHHSLAASQGGFKGAF